MIGHPYPSYRPSGVEWLGDIPEHWNVRRLGTVLIETVGGGTPDTSNEAFWADKDDPALSWVTISDMSVGGEITTTAKKVTSLGRTAARLRPLPSGTIIYSMYASVGAVARLATTAATNQAILGLIPGAMLKSSFLYWWLTGIRTAVLAQTRDNTQSNLNAETVRMIPVVLPPIAEQRAIADYLDTETARIDTLISKKRRLIELLAEYRTALITQTVTRGLDPSSRLRPSGVDWLGNIPTHWGSPKISHVAVLGSGHTPSRSVPEWWVPQECTVPWITTGEVANLRSDRIEYIERTRECVSEIGLANSSAVVHPADTVVLSRTASVGYSGIMATDMATSQDFATWTCGPNLLPRFLLLCLRAMRPDLLGRLTMGSTHKTIYMPDIQSLAIPLPPITEQHQIINAVWKQLKRLGPAEDRITAQISLLLEHRQSLISAAVTGELTVQN